MQLATRSRPTCPVAQAFVTTWESTLGEPDRRRLVAPLRARLGSTRTATGSAVSKSAAAADWLVHTAAPTWLEIVRPDPAALAALRACPSLALDTDSRKGRIAVDRAMQAVLAARMLACNAEWQRSRTPHPSLAEPGAAIVQQLLPLASEVAFGRTGYRAALAAAERAPFTNRWSTLRDHLTGLGQAAVATLTWDAVWSTAGSASIGTWTTAAQRRLDRELAAVTTRLQPHAQELGQRILAF